MEFAVPSGILSPVPGTERMNEAVLIYNAQIMLRMDSPALYFFLPNEKIAIYHIS